MTGTTLSRGEISDPDMAPAHKSLKSRLSDPKSSHHNQDSVIYTTKYVSIVCSVHTQEERLETSKEGPWSREKGLTWLGWKVSELVISGNERSII